MYFWHVLWCFRQDLWSILRQATRGQLKCFWGALMLSISSFVKQWNAKKSKRRTSVAVIKSYAISSFHLRSSVWQRSASFVLSGICWRWERAQRPRTKVERSLQTSSTQTTKIWSNCLRPAACERVPNGPKKAEQPLWKREENIFNSVQHQTRLQQGCRT